MQDSLIFALACFIPVLMTRERYSSLLGLVVVLIYLFLIRSSPPQLDMIHYDNYLSSGNVLACFASPYYLREPLFWCGAPVIYQLMAYVGYESLSWSVIDILVVMLVFRSLQKVDNRGIILFLLLLSLPSFLGVNNIYRQWIAMMLFIPAIVCFFDRRVFASMGWLLVSSLIHNTTLILVPIVVFLIFVRRLSLGLTCILFTLVATLVMLMLSSSISQKAGEFHTGLNVAPVLTFVVCVLSIVCYRPIAGVIGSINSGLIVCYISAVSIYVFIVASSGASERFSYFFMFFFMAVFFIYGKIRPVKIFYLFFFTVNIIAILSAPSTRAIAFNYFG